MLTIGVVLFVVWFVGFMILRKVVGALIHLVLVVAIIAIAWHFFGSADAFGVGRLDAFGEPQSVVARGPPYPGYDVDQS